MNDFSQALLKEMEDRGDYLYNQTINTIYLGGGTPSLLNAEQLPAIMDGARSRFSIAADAEVTLEANPDDIDEAKLRLWRQAGINRLSIGVQSFFPGDLAWMNRAHTADQALRSILLAQDSGFYNLSIDLIYGSPGLSDAMWQENMQRALDLQISHLSCYALTVEAGTALDVMTRKHKVLPVNNEDQARQFLMMTDFFRSHGYEHYEISNLAKPGWQSRHNSSYWNGAHYLGLGPSAHSFDGTSRQWNVANNALYIQSVKNGSVDFEKEILTDAQKYNEYVMTSLRKMEGIHIDQVRSQFGEERMKELLRSSKKFIAQQWIEDRSDVIVLTREGKLFADRVAAELFQ